MNNKNYYFSNASVNDRINKEKININEYIRKDYDSIYDVCKHIAKNKTRREINELFIEELSELIKAIIKLERWKNGDECLRVGYNEINDNIYDELADVIIMILQFSYKKHIYYDEMLKRISKKLIRYYETKQE